MYVLRARLFATVTVLYRTVLQFKFCCRLQSFLEVQAKLFTCVLCATFSYLDGSHVDFVAPSQLARPARHCRRSGRRTMRQPASEVRAWCYRFHLDFATMHPHFSPDGAGSSCCFAIPTSCFRAPRGRRRRRSCARSSSEAEQ